MQSEKCAVLTWEDLPSSPPQDDLQKLLAPLQVMPEEELDNLPVEPDNEELLSLAELLEFRLDGTPTWWPLNREENGGDWSLRQRRAVLLKRIGEKRSHKNTRDRLLYLHAP